MYENEIDQGVECLNNHFCGTGWADRIDLRTLSLENMDNCVLGQLFGFFTNGVEILCLHGLEASEHGFDFPVYDDLEELSRTDPNHPWNVLLNEWRARIEEIRAVRKKMDMTLAPA